MPTEKTVSEVTVGRIEAARRARFNPLRGLTPARLSRQLDSWRMGRLREFALVARDIEERDDTLAAVAPKRKKHVGTHGWEILRHETDRVAEADRHANALENFYNNIRCENAWEPEERGGWALLCRQMLDSVGVKRSVHEIVWRPRTGDLRATMRHVPLWFFEMETGRLRYLESEGASDGSELTPGEWMVTTGGGLMVASSILYMYKHLPLGDWVAYTEKFGFPLVHLGVPYGPDSPEWDAAEKALSGIINDSSLLYNNQGGAQLGSMSFGGDGQLPFRELIERCDRRMAALWRGSDLSTMSAQDSVGAEGQRDEAAVLETDDAMAIEEALEQYVSRHVIEWYFGVGVEPLAYLRVKTGETKDIGTEQKRLDAAVRAGVAVGARDYREALRIPTPEPGDGLVGGGAYVDDASHSPPARPAGPQPGGLANVATLRETGAANTVDEEAWQAYVGEGEEEIGRELLRAHRPLLEELAALLEEEDEEKFYRELERIGGLLPEEFAETVTGLAETFERYEGTAVVEGFLQGKIDR